MRERIPKSVAIRVPFKAYLSDGVTPATGKTIAITISKNMVAFANPNAGATNATEVPAGSNGWYYVDLDTTDTGTLGPLVVHGAATGVDNVDVAYNVVNQHNAGFDGVPDVVAGANTGLPIVGTQVPNATAGAAGGLFIAGTNAPVTISGSGNALTLTSTGANGHGLIATGNGSGDGIHGQGGATGDGIEGDGGASGNGIHALGGATNGAGLRAEAAGSNSAGLKALGFGSGAGLDGVGGATGQGAKFSGGATSGDGVTAIATGTVSNGITATGIGTGDGLKVVGGAGADGDGLHAAAGGGVDIRGNVLGQIDLVNAPNATALNAIADAKFDRANAIETGVTERNAERIMLAALAGKSDGFPGNPIHYRNVGDTKNRITATTDADGNRSAVTTDGT